MGKHEDKDKAEEQRIIESNGYKPGRGFPPESRGKHSKPDDTEDDDSEEKGTGT
jgi:hypothetical protein